MKRKLQLLTLAIAGFISMPTEMIAQDVEFKGLKNNMRYDSEEEYDENNYYIGWDSEQGKALFKTDQGIYSMTWNGTELSKPVQITEDNRQHGNSGAVYYDGMLFTVFSHDNEDGEAEFIVRKWDVSKPEETTLISQAIYPKSANIESRGMTYNPKDGKVYGLFYYTDIPINEEELDQEDLQEGYLTDAGYSLATVDLNTMKLTRITPGAYYENFVTLTATNEGKLFSMTSGGSLVEFNPENGLMIKVFDPSGIESQFKRQSACFDHKNKKLYWNGFVNSGKGYNEWGSYGELSDKEWKTNGKYDTALYEIDIETGKATKLSDIKNRISYSCMWVVGGDATDGQGNIDPEAPIKPEDDPSNPYTAIKSINAETDGFVQVYNNSGQQVYNGKSANLSLKPGLYIIKDGKYTQKVIVK